MSQINLKSISGITSITTPAGVDNQLTVHTNDTTEKLKLTSDGVNVTGLITATAADIDDFLDVGNNIKLGNAGVITATSFSGSGANLTGIDATALKDSAGNVKVQAQSSGAIVTGILTATTLVGAGTSGIKLPVGTTAQRDNITGMLRFNSTLNLPEYYNGTEYVVIDSPPTISSVSPTEVASDAGGNETFTISGSRFASGAIVKFISHTGTEITASSVTVNSPSQLTAVIAKNSFVNAQEPYDVKVVSASGLQAVLADQINVDNAPSWTTSAGSLGSIDETATGNHFTVAATDADGDTVSYSCLLYTSDAADE